MADRKCEACGAGLPRKRGRPPRFCKRPECIRVRDKRQPARIERSLAHELDSARAEKTRNEKQASRETPPAELTPPELQVVAGIRSGLHPADAAQGWMLPSVVSDAMELCARWLDEVRVVPTELPDGLGAAIRFGLACAQATQAWKVHVGQGLMNSPAAVREIWLASLTPIEPTADPQALAVARLERLTRLRAEASAADEPEAFAGLEVV